MYFNYNIPLDALRTNILRFKAKKFSVDFLQKEP